MNLSIQQDDPFKVLASTKTIVENLKYIKINEDNLNQISKIISQKLSSGLDSSQMHFGETGNLKDDVQLIFLEDVVNFCFWAEKDKPKWEIEWPKGNKSSGGWYSLTKSFQRGLSEGVPILKSDYLIELNLEQVRNFFRGDNGIEIPLFRERLKNLHEAGKVLKEKYDGEFVNALKDSNFDAVKIVKLIIEDFSSFRDIAKYKGELVYFLKRAQICAQDFSYLNQKYKEIEIKNIGLLTAFADYKIPQTLRKFGVISYQEELANKIDSYVLIPSQSQEEMEIRSATIWAVELIRQKLKKFSASDIDNALWLISQDQKDVKPYHRAYTIYY